jgi:hypothetical protein
MAKYLFIYRGGSNPEELKSDEAVKKAIDEWVAWFHSMGSAVIDRGNRLGKSSTVQADGNLSDNNGGTNPSGYSLIEASSLQDAHEKAKGCPILKAGGTIEIAPLDM